MSLDVLDAAPIRAARHTHACGHGRPAQGPAVHTYDTVSLYVGGRVRMEHRGELELQEGQVHLIPAGDAHRLLSASGSEAWGLVFRRSCLDPARYGELLAPLDRVRRGASPVVELPAERRAYVLGLLQELERDRRDGRAPPVVAESLLALVLAEIVGAGGHGATAPPRPSIVTEALAVIEARCLGPLTLQEVAAAVRRTPAYVTTAVKQATGRTVVAWIVEGRLAEARRRLATTDEHIDVIAERVGYTDPSHFARMFRRHHGLAPAAWRARQRGAG